MHLYEQGKEGVRQQYESGRSKDGFIERFIGGYFPSTIPGMNEANQLVFYFVKDFVDIRKYKEAAA